MLLEEKNFEPLLHGLVARLVGNNGAHEDMMQEARIFLWQMEGSAPGQRRAWYLQGCRLHLQNQMRLGRSIDSAKRCRAAMRADTPVEDSEDLLREFEINDTPWAEVSRNDILSVLSELLPSEGQQILLCLAEGLSTREVARRLGISHTWAAKQRRKIARLALRLGITLS